MASHKLVFKFVLACFCILLFPNYSHAAADHIAGGIRTSLASDSDDKVTLSLYYESLCPYSADFIVNQLVKVFETDLASVVNLRLVPWGNAQITRNNSWNCQHGPLECMLDKVEACAINVWPNPEVHFKFISCIERLRLKNMHNKWHSCFFSLGLSATPIGNCFNTGLALKLEHGYAEETARLNPPYRFVPWVLVNNRPLQEDFQNYVAYICRSYRGHKTLQACKHVYEIHSLSTVNSTQVCYKMLKT